MQKREDVVAGELLSTIQEVEFDDESKARDLAAEFLDQLGNGGGGAAGGEYVIDDQHLLAGFDGVRMDLEDIGPVFESVLHLDRLRGQLFGLADRDEAFT